MIEIAFYLCALYELGSDAATGWYSQETILQVIRKQFYLHDIGLDPRAFAYHP
jgi:hypothetical protein